MNSKSTESKRKLSAILFADIVSFTSLMEANEPLARQCLDKFHSTLKMEVGLADGKVVNNYGDGCLCTFDSAVNAMKCAKKVQEIFQTNPKIPVRIGIHSGDVFYEKDNVYGDSVNIASRMESLGVAGAILFSKRIKRDIANQTDFEIKELGEFEFKNVSKTMEVFALANEGIMVPDIHEMKGRIVQENSKKGNKWLTPSIIIGLLLLLFGFWKFNAGSKSGIINASISIPEQYTEKRVAVMIFDNRTGDENLEDFGIMVSDWITRGLMETGEANIISSANIQSKIAKLGINQGPNPELAASTGIDVMLEGRYYFQQEQLIIHSNIIEVKSGHVIHAIEPIQGTKVQMLDLLDELTQEVLGYWATKKQTRFLRNPPKYEAYQLYKKGFKNFASDFQKTESYLKQAYEIDTTFNAPLIKLIPLYRNNLQFDKANEIIAFFLESDRSLSQWERLRLEALDAFGKGDYLKSAQLNEKRYLMDLSDEDANFNAGSRYLQANYPQKSLDIFNHFDLRLLQTERILDWRGGRMVDVNNRVGKYEEAIKIAESYPYSIMYSEVARGHLRALIQLGKYEQLAKKLDYYKQMGIYLQNGERDNTGFLYQVICNEFDLVDNSVLLEEYAKEFDDWVNKNKDDPDDYKANRLMAAYYLQNYKQVIDWLEAQRNGEKPYFNKVPNSTLLGICYAKTNDFEKAQVQIDRILKMPDSDNLFSFGSKHYDKARIEAMMGQKDKAVQSLMDAIEAKIAFRPYLFERDAFLKSLIGYPPFEKLVEPKG